MSQNHPFFFSAGQPHQNHPLAMDPPFQASAVQPPSQQTVAQQNAQIASMDMSALEGISPERLAAIARLFQSGALQMPPPAPTVSTQLSHTGLPSSNLVQPASFDHQIQQLSTSTVRADVDMDTEEGEVDESEESSTHAKARDFLRPPPTGPRNRSVSPRERLQGKSRQKISHKPPVPSQTASEMAGSRHAQNNNVAVPTNATRPISNHEAAKMFVLEIVNAGYSYEDILPDIRNPKSLTSMFRELGLPTSPLKVLNQPSQQHATSAMTAPSQSSNAKPATTEEAGKPSLTKRAAPAKPAPIDRSEYLARLQAAKNKKTEAATASSEQPERVAEPEPVEGAKIAAQDTKSSQPSTSAAPTSAAQRLPAGKAASMTELARRKLEALKAQQAAKKSKGAAPSPVPKPSFININRESMPSPQSGLGAGLTDIPSQVAQGTTPQEPPVPNLNIEPQSAAVTQTTLSPTPQTPSRSFSSLPGLFMFDSLTNTQPSISPQPSQLASADPIQSLPSGNGQPHQASVSFSGPQNIVEPTTASTAPLSAPRKRPVAADFDDISFKPSSVKRPFGQSRNASEDESLVIQVSDDEDDDEAMDIEPIAESSKPVLQTKSFRDVGPLRDFPPKSSIYAQPSAPTTPGGVTYEQKMKEIEDIKRMIAEKERRQKENGKSTPVKPDGLVRVTSSPAATGNVVADSTPISPSKTFTATAESNPDAVYVSPTDSLGQATVQTAASVYTGKMSVDRPKSAVQLAKEREKEILRKRLLELENEVEDLSDPIEAPETRADPEYAMSGALPDTQTPTVAAEAASPPQIEQVVVAPETASARSASEEGEVSDDSMSKFYNLQGSNDGQTQFEAPPMDGISGPKASTASTGDSETEAKHAATPDSFAPWTQDALSPDSTKVEVATSQPNVPAGIEVQGPGAVWEDTEMTEDTYNPATAVVQEDLSESESMEEDDSDDDSDEEDSDRDDIEGPSYTPNGAASVAEDEHLNGTESSSPASSADAQDAQPELSISEPGRANTQGDTVADDTAPELQPSHEEMALIDDQVPAKPKRCFTPYRSPLAAFKDYRYHPEYLNTVFGGYKSITYSHNIDPDIPLCPFETAGGKCNDNSCQYQHFKSMFVSDNELLRAMGTKGIPAHGPEETKRWTEGLTAVIRELRDTNLDKDANVIAARIAQFRREFVGDATKILNLG